MEEHGAECESLHAVSLGCGQLWRQIWQPEQGGSALRVTSSTPPPQLDWCGGITPAQFSEGDDFRKTSCTRGENKMFQKLCLYKLTWSFCGTRRGLC